MDSFLRGFRMNYQLIRWLIDRFFIGFSLFPFPSRMLRFHLWFLGKWFYNFNIFFTWYNLSNWSDSVVLFSFLTLRGFFCFWIIRAYMSNCYFRSCFFILIFIAFVFVFMTQLIACRELLSRYEKNYCFPINSFLESLNF